MTFILKTKNNRYGMLVHIPKCAGSAIQKSLKQLGVETSRPFASMNHHRSFAESVTYAEKIKRYSELNLEFIILPWRNPIEWRLSLFNYAKRESPDVSFMPLENKYFESITFTRYVEHLCHDKNLKGLQQVSRSELAWNPMHSWYTLPELPSIFDNNMNLYFINCSTGDVFKGIEGIMNKYGCFGRCTPELVNSFTSQSERENIGVNNELKKKLLVYDMGPLLFSLSLTDHVQSMKLNKTRQILGAEINLISHDKS